MPRLPEAWPPSLIAALALALSVVPAGAQVRDLEDELRARFEATASRTDRANALQSLSNFGAAPGISAAVYNVDRGDPDESFDLDSYKLSPSYTFDAQIAGVRPYVEMTLGFLRASETRQLDTQPRTLTQVDYRTYSALGGFGVEVPLGYGIRARPIFLMGFSRVTDDPEAYGPIADEVLAAGKGLLFDVQVDTLLLGGAFELAYDRRFANDIATTATLRYNQLLGKALSASSPLLETNDNDGVFTANAKLDGPTPLRLLSRELRWIGYTSTTWLPGDQGDELGFNYFVELGGGIELVDRDIVSGIEGISLRASGIVGENVTGWSAGATFEF